MGCPWVLVDLRSLIHNSILGNQLGVMPCGLGAILNSQLVLGAFWELGVMLWGSGGIFRSLSLGNFLSIQLGAIFMSLDLAAFSVTTMLWGSQEFYFSKF